MYLTGHRLCRLDEFELDPASCTFARNGDAVTALPSAVDVLFFL